MSFQVDLVTNFQVGTCLWLLARRCTESCSHWGCRKGNVSHCGCYKIKGKAEIVQQNRASPSDLSDKAILYKFPVCIAVMWKKSVRTSLALWWWGLLRRNINIAQIKAEHLQGIGCKLCIFPARNGLAKQQELSAISSYSLPEQGPCRMGITAEGWHVTCFGVGGGR